MSWKLAGVVTIAHQDGPDVSRSAAGRAGAEGIWLPTSLLPRFGATWMVIDDAHIAARFRLASTPIEIHLELDPEGRIRSRVLDRWGDPDRSGRWAWHGFGGDVRDYRRFESLSIPSAGRLG